MASLRISAPLNNELQPALQWIEVATSLQIPTFNVVGLPGPEVGEARERIRAAITASGFEFPRRRILVNLCPASIRKQGTGLDLGMALAVLTTLKEFSMAALCIPSPVVAWGELGLDGSLKPSGQMTRALYAAWRAEARLLVISKQDEAHAHRAFSMISQTGHFKNIRPPALLAASHLSEVWTRLSENTPVIFREPSRTMPKAALTSATGDLLPLSPALERILGTTAAGNHHLLLLGPKGTGKTHALEWLATLQEPASAELRLERELLKELRPLRLINSAPNGVSALGQRAAQPDECFAPNIRRVGVHVRPAALIGSITELAIRPGEFSLAHGGLLIADELPEWPRDSREALREPMERGLITLSRSRDTVELPARFTLAATGNLCPCGGWPPEIEAPDPEELEAPLPPCRCSARVRSNYLSRLSGPVLDRIDMVTRLGPMRRYQKTSESGLCEKVAQARERAIRTWGHPAGMLSAAEVESIATRVLKTETDALRQFASLRNRHKILRLALTLASWDSAAKPSAAHFLEAACYRPERFRLG